jgi:hypothetical protein
LSESKDVLDCQLHKIWYDNKLGFMLKSNYSKLNR